MNFFKVDEVENPAVIKLLVLGGLTSSFSNLA